MLSRAKRRYPKLTNDDRIRTWLNGSDVGRITDRDWQRLRRMIRAVREEERRRPTEPNSPDQKGGTE